MKIPLMARLFRAALLPALMVGALVNSQTSYAADQDPANPSPSNNRPMTQVEEVNLFRANHNVVANPEVPVQHEEGELGILKRIAEELVYPHDAAEAGKKGIVIVEIVIDTEGNATAYKVIRSTRTQSLDEEALRVCKAKLSKGWIPAQDNGVPVISVIDVPVSFRLM